MDWPMDLSILIPKSINSCARLLGQGMPCPCLKDQLAGTEFSDEDVHV